MVESNHRMSFIIILILLVILVLFNRNVIRAICVGLICTNLKPVLKMNARNTLERTFHQGMGVQSGRITLDQSSWFSNTTKGTNAKTKSQRADKTIHHSIVNRGREYKDMRCSVCYYLQREETKLHVGTRNDEWKKKIRSSVSTLMPTSPLSSTCLSWPPPNGTWFLR